MAFKIGEGYTVFVGRSAAAPTTPTDPENMASLFELGEIPDAFSFSQTRAMIERFDRDSPGQRFVHPGRRTHTITFTLNMDCAGNTGLTALQGAMSSNTDGVGATGNLVYFSISNGVASDWLAHGNAGVSDYSVDLGAQNIIQASVTLEVNGDATVTTHA